MNSRAFKWILVSALVLVGLVLIVPGSSVAVSFSDSVEDDAAFCYDVIVPSSGDDITISINWEGDSDLDLYLYNPSGDMVDSSDDTYTNDEEIVYEIKSAGAYGVIVVGYDVSGVCTFAGDSNYPIKKTSTAFTGDISQGDEKIYEVKVNQPNKPLAISIEWDQSADSIDVKLYDPSGDLVASDPEFDEESSNTIFRWYKPKVSGTYELKIIGGVVTSSDKVQFEGTSSYPTEPKESGGGLGFGMMAIIIVVVLVVLVVVAFYIIGSKKKAKVDETDAAVGGQTVEPPIEPAPQYVQQPMASPEVQPPQVAPETGGYAAPVQPTAYQPPAQVATPPQQPMAPPAQPAAPMTPSAPAAPTTPPPAAPPATPTAPTAPATPPVVTAPAVPPATPITPTTPTAPPAAPAPSAPAPTSPPLSPAAPAAGDNCAGCGGTLSPTSQFCPNCGMKRG